MELLIVMAIIGILTAIVIPFVVKQKKIDNFATQIYLEDAKNCERKGGVPLREANGRVRNCIFPKGEKEESR